MDSQIKPTVIHSENWYKSLKAVKTQQWESGKGSLGAEKNLRGELESSLKGSWEIGEVDEGNTSKQWGQHVQ